MYNRQSQRFSSRRQDMRVSKHEAIHQHSKNGCAPIAGAFAPAAQTSGQTTWIPALAIEMVCCSMASWIATWSLTSILSNSSIQQIPLSASISAPASMQNSLLSCSWEAQQFFGEGASSTRGKLLGSRHSALESSFKSSPGTVFAILQRRQYQTMMEKQAQLSRPIDISSSGPHNPYQVEL